MNDKEVLLSILSGMLFDTYEWRDGVSSYRAGEITRNLFRELGIEIDAPRQEGDCLEGAEIDYLAKGLEEMRECRG